MPGSAKANERGRNAMASNVMLLSVRTTLTMMRKVRKRKKETIEKVRLSIKISVIFTLAQG